MRLPVGKIAGAVVTIDLKLNSCSRDGGGVAVGWQEGWMLALTSRHVVRTVGIATANAISRTCRRTPGNSEQEAESVEHIPSNDSNIWTGSKVAKGFAMRRQHEE